MNRFGTYRYLVMSMLGILSLMATTASSFPRLARAAAGSTDISISITEDRGTVRPGRSVTYTVRMTNLGPADAAFVDVAFQLPPSLMLVSMTCDLGISPDTPFCEYSSLPAGATVVSTLVATPKSAYALRTRKVRTAAAVSFENADAFDPNAANNTASVKTIIIGRARP